MLRTLTEARLVTMGEAGVELAHEALIREWPRLRAWLDDDREGLRIHRHLTHAAQDWEALGRDAAELYRGPRLAAALEWADAAGDGALNPLEREFLTASRARQQQEAREQAAQVRRLRRLPRRRGARAGHRPRRRHARPHPAAPGRRPGRAAREATLRADVGRLVAESKNLADQDRYLSTLLALEAHRLADNAATRGALLSALHRGAPPAGRDGDQRLGPVRGILCASRQAARRTHRHIIDFFDTRTGRRAGASIEVEPGVPESFAVSPDGGLVAAGSRDGTVTLWDVNTRDRSGPALTLEHDSLGLAFSPDGKWLVTLEGELRRHEPDGHDRIRPRLGCRHAVSRSTSRSAGIRPRSARPRSAPTARWLVTGGNDGAVVLHDAATGATLGPPLFPSRASSSASRSVPTVRASAWGPWTATASSSTSPP